MQIYYCFFSILQIKSNWLCVRIYNTIQKFVVSKIFHVFWGEKSVLTMLTNAAFI